MLIYLQMIESEADRTKFERVYAQYRGLLFHVAYQILQNNSAAEDAVSDAFLSIAENIEKIFDPVCPKTKAFAVIIVERKAIDILRKKRGVSEEELDENAAGLPVELPEESALTDAILRLRPHYRQVILLRYVHGYSGEETAKILGLSPDAARKLDYRAREKLKEMLQEAFFQWVWEIYEDQIVYRFSREQREDFPAYRLTWLSEGYVETDFFDGHAIGSITYENAKGDVFYFDFSPMQEGSTLSIPTDGMIPHSVSINGLPGHFYESSNGESFNELVWIDEDSNMMFDLTGFLEKSVMLHIAENISLDDSAK